MEVKETKLEGVLILSPKVFGDNRGWFTESWSKRTMLDLGLEYDFVQDNHSYSANIGTLRGLHFQSNPKAQAKLIRCTQGAIMDFAVDIRKGSPNYGQWISEELSEGNKKQLLIPSGFAHGFITLTDDVEVQYKADEYYSPKHDGGFAWNDPSIGVNWGIENPILSEKDKNAPLLKDSMANFIYQKG